MEREWNSADEEMAQVDRELEQMGFEALDRCLEKGAAPEDLKTLAWIAGLEWTPERKLEIR